MGRHFFFGLVFIYFGPSIFQTNDLVEYTFVFAVLAEVAGTNKLELVAHPHDINATRYTTQTIKPFRALLTG